MAEDSGTAAPDPRIAAVARCISTYERPDHFDRENAREVLMEADAADRAAGVIRVRIDDAIVEKGLAAYRQATREDEWTDTDCWETGWQANEYRRLVRAVLEALATPPPVG